MALLLGAHLLSNILPIKDKGEAPKREPKTPIQKLHISARVTSNCRYRAAIRLRMSSQASFIATTVLSLGLILIPLFQNAGIKLSFQASVINSMQLFLAVSVLVYSVTMAKAGYEVRAEKLNACGDNLKILSRKLDEDIAASDHDIKQHAKRYANIVASSENHEDIDYLISRLDMVRDYNIVGMERFILTAKSYCQLYSMYLVPVFMIATELTFFTDMIGVTSLYPQAFRVAYAPS